MFPKAAVLELLVLVQAVVAKFLRCLEVFYPWLALYYVHGMTKLW